MRYFSSRVTPTMASFALMPAARQHSAWNERYANEKRAPPGVA
jgi:hypothetical protein